MSPRQAVWPQRVLPFLPAPSQWASSTSSRAEGRNRQVGDGKSIRLFSEHLCGRILFSSHCPMRLERKRPGPKPVSTTPIILPKPLRVVLYPFHRCRNRSLERQSHLPRISCELSQSSADFHQTSSPGVSLSLWPP